MGANGGATRVFAARLNDADRTGLSDLGSIQEWDAGVAIFHEGDPPRRVLLIECGIVKTVSTSSNGAEVILALRGPGALVGELSALDGGARSAGASAVSDVRAVAIDATRFRDYLRDRPDVAQAMIETLVDRLRDASRRQVAFGTVDSALRLAWILADLAEAHGTPDRGGLRLTLLSQDELASLCGASRDSIARSLRRFREDGLVSTSRRAVTVHDVVALRRWTGTLRSTEHGDPGTNGPG